MRFSSLWISASPAVISTGSSSDLDYLIEKPDTLAHSGSPDKRFVFIQPEDMSNLIPNLLKFVKLPEV